MATYGVLVTASDDGLQSLIELRQKLGSLVSGFTHGDGFCGKSEESVPDELGESRGTNGTIRSEHSRTKVPVSGIATGAMLRDLLGRFSHDGIKE